jgi:hypothetical protein
MSDVQVARLQWAEAIAEKIHRWATALEANADTLEIASTGDELREAAQACAEVLREGAAEMRAAIA